MKVAILELHQMFKIDLAKFTKPLIIFTNSFIIIIIVTYYYDLIFVYNNTTLRGIAAM